MKRGFTLIELMVVVGIMAFLGVAATGGYNTMQRGMAESGATEAASTLLRAAKERALVDRSPTIVYFYNRLLREATAVENAIVVGEAVAIRRAGRISCARGRYLIDEFMDVLGSYDIVKGSEIQERKGMKLWQFPDTRSSQMRYSIVADAVTPLQGVVGYNDFGGWAESSTPGATNMPSIVYSFYDLNESSYAGQWKNGTAYGFEFARVQLPHNFVFASSVPSSLGSLSFAKACYFDPEQVADETVDVFYCIPNASGLPQPHHRAGTASSRKND